MLSTKAFELLENGTLKKGCTVTMPGLKGFDKLTVIDDAYIKKARQGEMEDDWVVIIINGQMYDTAWIEDIGR